MRREWVLFPGEHGCNQVIHLAAQTPFAGLGEGAKLTVVLVTEEIVAKQGIMYKALQNHAHEARISQVVHSSKSCRKHNGKLMTNNTGNQFHHQAVV
jgi:hypothetical protein